MSKQKETTKKYAEVPEELATLSINKTFKNLTLLKHTFQMKTGHDCTIEFLFDGKSGENGKLNGIVTFLIKGHVKMFRLRYFEIYVPFRDTKKKFEAMAIWFR